MAFNADPVVEAEFKRLFNRYKIEEIVETGTYKGDTTKFFASFGKTVHTIEVNPETFTSTQQSLRQFPNVKCYLGNSVDVLPKLELKGPTLFYLDAHWHNYWPLRDELRFIRPLQGAVIIIDDFKTPNRSFQFDKYKEQPCSFDYIKDVLPSNGTYYYLNRSERRENGVGKFYWVPDSGDGLFFTSENGERYSTI